MILKRTDYLETGIFGVMTTDDGSETYCTLEHAFLDPNGVAGFLPAIPAGTYQCTRYLSPKFGYDVFVLNGVPDHTFCEIHRGNYNADSDGCILIGLARQDNKMILNSAVAFTQFMDSMDGINSFTLTIS
jgi:hypothetical protein